MNKRVIIWSVVVAALAAAGIWAYSKVNKLLKEYDKTYFEYDNLSINFWAVLFGGSKSLNGSFDFIIDNRGNLDVEMTKLKLWVYIGGEKAAWITSRENVFIKPNEKTKQTLSFSTPITLINPMLGVLASNYNDLKNLDVEYKGTMWVKVGVANISIPLPFNDKYKMLELIG